MNIEDLESDLKYSVGVTVRRHVLVCGVLEDELETTREVSPEAARSLADRLTIDCGALALEDAHRLSDALIWNASRAEAMKPLSEAAILVYQRLQIIDGESAEYHELHGEQHVIRLGAPARWDLAGSTGLGSKEVMGALDVLFERGWLKPARQIAWSSCGAILSSP